MAYELPELPYPADALEPYIDQKTMEIHHGKHHAGYVEKLNSALEQEPSLLEKSLPELLANECRIVPESIRTAVRNNGGGHANHELFWTLMSPDPKQEPGGTLIQAIEESFGGLDKLKQGFHQAAIGRFGSGWAWVVLDLDGKLEITSTPNQDSPLMTRQSPVLALDVWEHAYYLKYQNRRADYVQAWWNVVDWAAVERRYTTLQKVRLDAAGVSSGR